MKKALLLINLRVLVFELFPTPTFDEFVATHKPHPRDLAACAMQQSFQIRGRLVALLVLYKVSLVMYGKVPMESKAEVYCGALQVDALGGDDAWGSLWFENDAGILGYHIVSQGLAAIPFLTQLLDDATMRNRFHAGGEKSALLEIRQYRLKDFAAYYIAKIRGYELPWKQSHADRDAAIKEMREVLGL